MATKLSRCAGAGGACSLAGAAATMAGSCIVKPCLARKSSASFLRCISDIWPMVSGLLPSQCLSLGLSSLPLSGTGAPDTMAMALSWPTVVVWAKAPIGGKPAESMAANTAAEVAAEADLLFIEEPLDRNRHALLCRKDVAVRHPVRRHCLQRLHGERELEMDVQPGAPHDHIRANARHRHHGPCACFTELPRRASVFQQVQWRLDGLVQRNAGASNRGAGEHGGLAPARHLDDGLLVAHGSLGHIAPARAHVHQVGHHPAMARPAFGAGHHVAVHRLERPAAGEKRGVGANRPRCCASEGADQPALPMASSSARRYSGVRSCSAFLRASCARWCGITTMRWCAPERATAVSAPHSHTPSPRSPPI